MLLTICVVSVLIQTIYISFKKQDLIGLLKVIGIQKNQRTFTGK